MVGMALEAAKMLEEEGISARVINIHTIKPLDEELVVKAAMETGKVVTIEEHSVIGGLGGAVAEVLSEKALQKCFVSELTMCSASPGRRLNY